MGYFEVVARWTDIALGKTTKGPLKNDRMPVRGDMIYSYGSHFEMARALRDRKGNVEAFLINGDTWGPTTSKHQSQVRDGIQRTGVQSVTIPYQALNAAGISRDSVIILDVSQDRWEVTEHSSHDLPENAEWRWVAHKIPVEMTKDEQALVLAAWKAHHERGSDPDWTDRVAGTDFQDLVEQGRWVPPVEGIEHEHSYNFTGKKMVPDYYTKMLGCKKGWQQFNYQILPDGRDLYTWETTRHWLGESLISGEVTYSVMRHCRACKDSGIAEGPRNATWHYKRDYQWEDEGRIIIEWSELMQERRPRCPDCLGRGTWRETRNRRAKFLSGFDANEKRPSYFFCELPPKSPARTLEEAYEALKPDAVRLAEQMGREIRRQGDIFAIPLVRTTKRDLRKAGARIERMGRLFGTNHVATEVAYMPDGNTLVRGTLHHRPDGRRPDHARVNLGDWHVVVKNLVPTAA